MLCSVVAADTETIPAVSEHVTSVTQILREDDKKIYLSNIIGNGFFCLFGFLFYRKCTKRAKGIMCVNE